MAFAAAHTRQVMAMYKKAISEPGYIKYAISPDGNTDIWYGLITNVAGSDDEYEGGEYLIRIEMKHPAPIQKPPAFFFMTPNGLFTPDVITCISTGGFHWEQYRASGGMARFCNDLISGLVGWREMEGLNLIETTLDEKRAMAKASRWYNREYHGALIDHIEKTYAEYSAAWKA